MRGSRSRRGRRRRRWFRRGRRWWRRGSCRWRWCGGRWRRTRWRGRLWCFLGGLLRLAVGTQLLLCLSDDERRGLRGGTGGRKLRSRESCRGKQQEAKLFHDGFGPRKVLVEGLGSWKVLAFVRSWQDLSPTLTINKTSVRPDCGGLQMTIGIYFRRCGAMMHACSRPIQRARCALPSIESFAWSLCGYLLGSDQGRFDDSRVCRRRRRIRPFRSAYRRFVGWWAGEFIGPRRFTGLTHRRRNLGARIPGWAFHGRFRRLPRLDRRMFGRVDRHFCNVSLRLPPRSGAAGQRGPMFCSILER
jgi:hypothetical protein